MSVKEYRKCKTCAWLKQDETDVMNLCQLKGFYVYKNSLACSDWSEFGLF